MTTKGPSSLFCFQMIPADVESPEFCLGLQTLLSLKVRMMLALDPHCGLTQRAGKGGKRHRCGAWVSF